MSRPNGYTLVVPFCPLLTNTWSLLRPRGVTLPEAVVGASAYLTNSLWTTFEPEGAAGLEKAIEGGEIA